MKLLIASDIHGSAYWCAEVLSAFENEKTIEILDDEFALVTAPMTYDELIEKTNGLDVISKYMFV